MKSLVAAFFRFTLFFFFLLLASLFAALATAAFSFHPSSLTPKVQPKPGQKTFLQRFDQLLTKLQNPTKQLQNHTYLSDNYAPVLTEHVNLPVQDVVYGSLPTDLNGMLCRNGPNPAIMPRTKLHHWFDGDAMLHNLRLCNGKAHYTNQFVPSIRYQIEQALGGKEQFYPTLGEYTGLWGFIKLFFHPAMVNYYVHDFGLTSSPPNTACLMYQHKFYCLNEANVPFECRILPDGRIQAVGYEYFNITSAAANSNATTKDTKQVQQLDYPVSAHPRIDPVSGDLFFHSYTVGASQVQKDGPIKIGRYSATTRQLESYFGLLDQKHISFAHNLLLTDDYIVIYDCSVHFSPEAIFQGGSFFRTNADHNLRFGVMPKTATSQDDVMWFDTGAPGGIVHPLNAWQAVEETSEEEDGNKNDTTMTTTTTATTTTIVIWTPFCPNLNLDLETDEINRFSMVEFRVDLATGQVTKKLIDNSLNVEFSVVPTMGRFTRYGYTAIQDPSTPGEGSFTGFCVWDMLRKRLHASVYYDGVGGEPMLLQSCSSGKVYIGVYVQKGNTSYFELYDGESTELVCRLRMPACVPFGFHGLWIPEEELQGHFDYHEQASSNARKNAEVLSS